MKFLIVLLFGCFSFYSIADEEFVFMTTIENHQFNPSEIRVPIGKRIKLRVINDDPTVEEFESFDLNREKIIPGRGEIKVIFGPLKPGVYKFFGEFHEKTAQGKIIAE